MGGRPVTLGAYPATQCPVRTHHAFDPNITLMPAEQPPAIQEAIDAGLAFEHRHRAARETQLAGEQQTDRARSHDHIAVH